MAKTKTETKAKAVTHLEAVKNLLVGEDTVYAASIPIVRATVKEPIGYLTCARFDLDVDYMALIVRKPKRELTTYGVAATKNVVTSPSLGTLVDGEVVPLFIADPQAEKLAKRAERAKERAKKMDTQAAINNVDAWIDDHMDLPIVDDLMDIRAEDFVTNCGASVGERAAKVVTILGTLDKQTKEQEAATEAVIAICVEKAAEKAANKAAKDAE